jgi:photosystem II stability/assembly factor-like uncharacterized protein
MAGASAFSTSSDGGDSWGKWTQPAGADATFHAGAFDGRGSGWMVGIDTVMSTTDRGATWRVRHLAGDFESVAVRSGAVWIGGADDAEQHPVILRSTDAGGTWTKALLPAGLEGPWISSLSMADGLRGWALSNGALLHTSDGGLRWQRQDTPSARTLIAVTCVDAGHAWLVGQSWHRLPLVLATVDGGRTWTVQRNGGVKGAVLSDVVFLDRNHGWAAGKQGVVLRTVDGGRHWRSGRMTADSMHPFILSIDFSDAEHGWTTLGGFPPSSTSDGGRTWKTEALSGGDFQLVFVTERSPQ